MAENEIDFIKKLMARHAMLTRIWEQSTGLSSKMLDKASDFLLPRMVDGSARFSTTKEGKKIVGTLEIDMKDYKTGETITQSFQTDEENRVAFLLGLQVSANEERKLGKSLSK